MENIILQLDYVSEVIVYGEKNFLVGNIVCAKVKLKPNNTINNLDKDIKKHCSENLQSFKVPIKIKIDDDKLHGTRFKKIRR